MRGCGVSRVYWLPGTARSAREYREIRPAAQNWKSARHEFALEMA